MNRREFLGRTGVAGLGMAAGLKASEPTTPSKNRKRCLRFAHLTDIHVSDAQGAEQGMRAAIRSAQSQADKPELLLFGGDCIGDALNVPKSHAKFQWDLWHRIFSEEVKTPYRLCLGNHDIYGWKRHDDPALPADPEYGKAMGLANLGLDRGYYSFDQGGWHFVVLDSMQIDHGNDQGYVARLDDLQFDWLEKDLAATPAERPVCVLSHIPILSAAAFLDGDLNRNGSYEVPGAWMHLDCRRIKDLFLKHPNVKACLSGHLHMVDDVRYLGIRYLCNGAVCGGWWKGKYQEFGPLYTLIDAYDDGSLDVQYVNY